MAEKLILTDGLLIGKKELAEMQSATQLNLSRLVGLIASIPTGGAVFTTKTTAGVLGTHLLPVPGGGTSLVNAGTAIAGDLSYINVPTNTTPTGTFSNSTSVKVILSAVANTLETGTVSIASDHITLTFTVDVSAIYSAGDNIRLSNSANGNNGTYRLLSVSGTTAVLTTASTGTTEAGMSHSVAGKFFPGYPLSGTTDIASHDGFALTYQSTGYTPLANEIHLATLAKDGSGVVTLTTDFRVPITPNMLGRIITDADVSTTAAIAESKIALTTATQNAKTWAHQQNTDTYTTSSTFRVAGASGPRVLTTDDLPSGAIVSPPPAITSLTTEVNFRVSFYNTLASIDSTIANGPKFPGLQVDWGILGTGTYSAGVFSVTGAHNSTVTLGSNALIDHVLVDTAGQLYRITASQAVAVAGAFTVNVFVDTGAGQPNPTNGAVTIRNAAKSYTVQTTDSVTGAVQQFTPPTPSNGILLTTYRPPMTGVAGRGYRVDLISTNNSLTPTSTTNSTVSNFPWGTIGTSTVVNVPSSSITVSPNASYVNFSWPAPSGYDRTTMDYMIAWSTSSTPSTFYNLTAYENADGSGAVQISAVWPQIAQINIKVVDMSGTSLSTVIGTATGQPTQVATQQNLFQVVPFQLTNGSFSLSSGLLLAGAGNLGYTSQLAWPKAVAITGAAINITSNSGDMTVKGWVYPTGNFSSGVATVPLTSSGSGLTLSSFDPNNTQFGTRVSIDVEKVSGSTGTIIGQIYVYFIETGSTSGIVRYQGGLVN